jgi:hypothetical protein
MVKHGSGYDIANTLHRIDTRAKTHRFINKFAKKEYPIKAGSTFDGDGVLRNWWTDADKTEFKIRTANLLRNTIAMKPLR